MAVVQADEVISVAYDHMTDSFTGVTLQTGRQFAVFHFKEDEASYSEKAAANPTGILVTHSLSFALERMGRESATPVEQLATAAPNGYIAIVTFNNDESVLAGYSRRFGLEYPLRLQTATGNSGLKITDISAENITLVSVDTQKAKAFTGTIPQ